MMPRETAKPSNRVKITVEDPRRGRTYIVYADGCAVIFENEGGRCVRIETDGKVHSVVSSFTQWESSADLIAELEKIDREMSGGPWVAHNKSVLPASDDTGYVCNTEASQNEMEDAFGIATLRTRLPEILSRLRCARDMSDREARLLALLREAEWGQDGVVCVVCGQLHRHAPDCRLAAELAAGPSPMAADRLPSETEGEG